MDKIQTYKNQTDESLIQLLRQGDGDIMDFLLEKYKYLVRMKANTMFLLGGDTDDLIQEGMIGLFKAIRDFDERKDSSFSSFAGLCINRQIYKAVEAASRKKHGPLNSYVSLSAKDETGGEETLQGMIADATLQNPEYMLIHQESMEQLLEQVNQALSPMERQILKLYLDGADYHQIAETMGKTEKTIDNGLQRIKKKVAALQDQER